MISDAGLSSREGCGNTIRNVTGDPWAGVTRGRALRHHALRGGLRALLRAPPGHAADAAQVQDRVHGHRRGPRDHRHPRHRLHPAHRATACAGFEIRVGGGTSIMPRVAPTLYEFVELDDGEYLKVVRGRAADLRPPGLAAREPRPRPDQGPDRQGRHRRLPRDGRGGARGRLGRRARLRRRARCCSIDDEEANAPPPPASYGSPNGDRSRVRPLRARRTCSRSARRASRRSRSRSPAATSPPSSSAASPQIMRDLHGRLRAHDACTRTSSCAGCATSRVYDVWQRLERARPRRRRRPRDHRRRQLPRHRQLQARHHQLDGPQPGGPGAARGRWRSTDPLTQADPREDERLPERLRPAPHRQHRLLRRLDQGRRAARCPPTSPTSAATTRAARSSMGQRLKVAPPRQARPGRGRALGAPVRGRARTTARSSTTSSSGSAPTAFEAQVKDLSMPVEFSLENITTSSTGAAREPYQVSAARASARSR